MDSITINVPVHVCDGRCEPSPAEAIMANTWGVSHEQAHAINEVVFASLLQSHGL